MAAKKVVLYFDNHVDALHFTLAASSVMAGDNRGRAMTEMVSEVARASRITVNGTLDPQNPAADDADVTQCSEVGSEPVSSSAN